MSAVFLSYSSEQADTASRIELSLREDGHSVFRDRSSLPPGEGFDARIRAAVDESDVFVFLISRESVSPSRYTLTELKFAEEKWGNPSGRVLPVMVEPVPGESIPAFLRAVTILKPQGNLTAEVAAAVALMSASWWRRMLEPKRLAPTLVAALAVAAVAGIGVPAYLERSAINAQARSLIKQSDAQAEFEDGWKLLQEAHAVAPVSREVFEAQERLAMEWLRKAIFLRRADKAYLDSLVERTQPVLSRGATEARGARLADILAHMGWSDYLLDRGGRSGKPNSMEYYQRALAADPRNAYARAFQGYEAMWRMHVPDIFPDARKLFSEAAELSRANAPVHDYVRFLQLWGLLEGGMPDWVREAIRVANEMRIGGEKLPEDRYGAWVKRRLYYAYDDNVGRDAARDRRGPLLAALPPAEHLQVFQWLFSENDLPANVDRDNWLFHYFYTLAGVQEYGGDRTGAIASYRRVLDVFTRKKYDAPSAIRTAEDANAAIKRLSN
jgi:TIR domain